jgi:NTP pyrophosphatase (non-canonical NTP hydrolase)
MDKEILQTDIVLRVLNERVRQDAKWGYPRPELTDAEWLTILTEEVGEAAEATLEVRFGIGSVKTLKRELIQVVAVGIAWLEHLEVRPVDTTYIEARYNQREAGE